MNWYKALVTELDVNQIQFKFSTILARVPRPQTTFMYESIDPVVTKKDGETDIKYEIYFTPSCVTYMNDLIIQYGFQVCSRPNRDDVIGLCTIQDFEELVWV